MRLFHALYLGHLPPSSFLEELSSEQFAELGAIHLLAFSSGLFFGLPIFRVSVLNNLQGRFHILSSFFGGWGVIHHKKNRRALQSHDILTP